MQLETGSDNDKAKESPRLSCVDFGVAVEQVERWEA